MKQIFLWWLMGCLCTSLALAETPASAVQVLSMQNPSSYAGIQIGDVLQRKVRLSVAATDKLNEDSLPLKGLLREGIELRQVQVEQQAEDNKKIYSLTLDYQVFASSGKPVQLQLPAEKITFASGATVDLPTWRFWLMAQLPDQLQQAKQSVIPQFKPSLLDTETPRQVLILSVFVSLIGILVLIYRNADWTWLPMMNGHFAHAYRKLKQVPASVEGQKQAALIVQNALNQRFGQQMLSHHVNAFIAQQPAFEPLANEIEAFFVQANAVLYGGQQTNDYVQQCLQLTRQLRDCERRV